MIPKKQQLLAGWGNFPIKQCEVFRPERPQDVTGIYRDHTASVVARGAGRSYGDAAMNREGVILSERLNRFLDFDEKRGLIRVQAGVTLDEILRVVVPHGWLLPVIPGTKFASIGGCIAANVHGKNEYKKGELATHILSMTLKLPNRDRVECSPETRADIFWATAGGMGMTGFIEEVTLKLMPITSPDLKVETRRVASIEEMTSVMRKAVGNSDYMVGWIDHFGKGESLGRGIFEQAVHSKKSDKKALKDYIVPAPEITVPFYFPSFVLNRYTMALYNRCRFSGISEFPKTSLQSLEQFFHPLDNINGWNKIYGKRGFLQYQCLVPEGLDAVSHLRQILHMIQQRGLFSFLAVIKYHGPHEGMLSFSKDGFSLALDFPNTPKVHALLDDIDAFLCDIDGRVYLAKDARLKPSHFEIMYAEHLDRWRRIVNQLDPKGKIKSSMARRLGLRGGGAAS